MFLKQNKSHKGILLTYTIGYRENGKVKHKNVETIGYLHELKKKFDDPIAHFKAEARKITNEEANEFVIKNINSKTIDSNDKPKNIGYIFLNKLYKDLQLDTFFKDKQKNIRSKYDLNGIFSLLVFSRILFPASKLETFNNRDVFFEEFDFSLDDVYRSLGVINGYKDELEKLLWNNSKERYQRDTSSSYYDCTNYYFEIEYNDDDKYTLDNDGNIKLDSQGKPIISEKGYRKRGPEKNKRPDPIVSMGLLMDSTGLPLSYDLFPGNESEKQTLIPILKNTKNKFKLERTIVVADRGLNCSNNVFHISGTSLEQSRKMDGYVYGQSVRGADDEFKQWVLKQNYTTSTVIENNKEISFTHKSRIYPKDMYIVREDKGLTKSGNPRKQKIKVDQKQMVYFSQKYADKQKHDRDKMVTKAKDLIKNPESYTKATSYGAANYVNNLHFSKETGEIADTKHLTLNEEKIKEEAKYDGYYSIVTSEEKLSDIEIRNIYRGLAKIEDTFKVTKHTIDSRPVYVRLKDHIESHFLTCFVSLAIIRFLETELKNKYSADKIVNSMKSCISCKIEHDIYLQSYTDEIIKELQEIFDVNISNKFLNLSKIKKML